MPEDGEITAATPQEFATALRLPVHLDDVVRTFPGLGGEALAALTQRHEKTRTTLLEVLQTTSGWVRRRDPSLPDRREGSRGGTKTSARQRRQLSDLDMELDRLRRQRDDAYRERDRAVQELEDLRRRMRDDKMDDGPRGRRRSRNDSEDSDGGRRRTRRRRGDDDHDRYRDRRYDRRDHDRDDSGRRSWQSAR